MYLKKKLCDLLDWDSWSCSLKNVPIREGSNLGGRIVQILSTPSAILFILLLLDCFESNKLGNYLHNILQVELIAYSYRAPSSIGSNILDMEP